MRLKRVNKLEILTAYFSYFWLFNCYNKYFVYWNVYVIAQMMHFSRVSNVMLVLESLSVLQPRDSLAYLQSIM